MTRTNEERIATLEANLKSVTDSLKNLDSMVDGTKHMYFRCLHSHKLFKGDYIRQWGIRYGVGLGGDVRSECLDTMYEQLPYIGSRIKNAEGVMHPCRVSGAPLDLLFLPTPAKPAQMLIEAYEDPYGEKRALIIQANQLKHPASRVAQFRALYIQQGGRP